MKSKSWNVIRTIGFIIVGLMNSVLIRPEDRGTFKNYIGILLLILGYFDALTIILTVMKRKVLNLQRVMNFYLIGAVLVIGGIIIGMIWAKYRILTLIISGFGLRIMIIKKNKGVNNDN